jgi:hypothetical protein
MGELTATLQAAQVGPGDGCCLDYGEAFSVAVRKAVIKYGLSARQARRLIAACNQTLAKQVA